ncbi:upstream stimulatory factor 2-like isoform X1 [Homarus americanus]|nr:upstream stimulatory factor 2-like isoform X1 [Homarus americanus]
MDMIETTLDSSGDKDCDCEDEKVGLAQRLGLEDEKVALAQRLGIVDEKVALAQRLGIDEGGVRDSSLALAPGFTLRPESEHSGTLAYRVVQFSPDGAVDGIQQGGVQASVPSLLATNAQPNGSPSDSPETRLALITSSDVPSDGGSTVVVSGGQFYVISDVLTNTTPRNLAPRTSESVMSPRFGGSTREEKRRVTHNEVERRRRDKINTWICRLAKIIPDCPEAHSKSSQSKGGILAKACDYISELRIHNEQLTERMKETQRREMDFELLKQEVEVLKNENAALKNENALVRAQMQQQGLLGDLPP